MPDKIFDVLFYQLRDSIYKATGPALALVFLVTGYLYIMVGTVLNLRVNLNSSS